MILSVHIQLPQKDQRWQVLPSAAPVCPSFTATHAGYRRNEQSDHATGGGVAVHR
jgi:hypothetical protein